MNSKKIMILGYYGFNNSGDELLLKNTLKDLTNYQKEIIVLSNNPTQTSEEYNVKSIYRYNLFKIIHNMKKDNFFLLGGGTIFQDETSNRSFLYYSIIVILAIIKRMKIIFYSNGFDKLKNKLNKKILKIILNNSTLITLRDNTSLKNLIELKTNKDDVFITTDLAFNSTIKEKTKQSIKKIGISLKYSKDLTEKRQQLIAEAFDELVKKGYELTFIEFQEKNDAQIIKAIRDKMKLETNILEYQNNLIEEFINFDFIIGMRLHSLIYSTIANIPFIGITSSEKNTSYLSDINYNYKLSLDKINKESLLNMINNIKTEYKIIQKQLQIVSKKNKKKAEKNKELLNIYLSK